MTINSDTSLRLSAQRALYGEVGPNLVRFTGEIRDKTIFLQFIVLETADKNEIENYQSVAAGVVGDYVDEMVDERFIRVAAASDARNVSALSNLFFCRNLHGVSSDV